MLIAIIAVLGTLAGSAIAHLSQRAHRKADDTRNRRTDAVTAVAELATALADHRRAMWLREDLRLRGQGWEVARAESHATRSALTAPLLRVQILLPAAAASAQTATKAAYALRGANGETALAEARKRAIKAADEFVATAGASLAHDRTGGRAARTNPASYATL